MLGYLSADVVTAACAHIPVMRGQVGVDGSIADEAIRRRVVDVLTMLARHGTGEQTYRTGV